MKKKSSRKPPAKKRITVKPDLEEMTVVQLRALAKKRRIELPSRMLKAEIVRALRKSAPVPPKRTAPEKPKKIAAKPRLESIPRPIIPRPVQPTRPMETRRAKPPAASETGPPQPVFHPIPNSGELPGAYGEDVISLLPRDPDSAYTYWEATERALDRAYQALGERSPDARLTLRVVELSSPHTAREEGPSFDVEIFHRIGSWNLELRKPGCYFMAILGVKSRSGRFFEIARSIAVKMPRASVSDWIEDEESLEEVEQLFTASSGGGLWSASSAGGGEEANRRAGRLWIFSPSVPFSGRGLS